MSILLFALAVGGSVLAAENDCPDPVDDNTCNSVCAYSGTTWTCTVSGGPSTVTLVEGYSTNAGVYYSAWGDNNGTGFCCSLNEEEATTFVIAGSNSADSVLRFTFNDGVAYDLQPTGATAITGTINANDGADVLRGSNSTSASYSETLNGQANDDVIFGNAGADTCNGGSGNDDVQGGAGNDVLYGGAGIDTTLGGSGNDTMFGEGDVDYMQGAEGDDTMDGGLGGDEICGGPHGAGGDYLTDGDSNAEATPDQLWAASSTDLGSFCYSGAGTDWDGDSPEDNGVGTCADDLPSQPTNCP